MGPAGPETGPLPLVQPNDRERRTPTGLSVLSLPRISGAMRAGARVLVAVADVSTNDRLVSELLELGVDPTPAFSDAETIGALASEKFDALIAEQASEEASEPLRRWLKAHFKGVVVFVQSYDDATRDEEAAEAAILLAKALRKAGMLG
jgi:hypothetical protein